MTLQTIKSRPDFLAVRGGVKFSVPAFLIEAKPRKADAREGGARFGFTVTKKLGNAVTRNRIRRRLKAAMTAAAVPLARDGFDYVVVARAAAFDFPYAKLLEDVARAMKGVHKPQAPRQQRLDKGPLPMKKPEPRDPA